MKKIAICGTHGVGKTTICQKVYQKLYDNYFKQEEKNINKDGTYGDTEIYYGFKSKFEVIPEQYRVIMNELKGIDDQNAAAETLATYHRHAYLENIYEAQGKNIICDRSVLDTFVYFRYFLNQIKTNEIDCEWFSFEELGYGNLSFMYDCAWHYMDTYSKIYLIAPDKDKPIVNDGFRMTDKKQQLEIHDLFLSSFEDFDNVEVVHENEAWKPEFVERVVKEFSV